MIITLSHVTVRAEHVDEMLRLLLRVAERSLAQPGCIANAAYRDAENPLRLLWVEKWVDKAAMQQCARVLGPPRELGAAMGTMVTEFDGPEIYAAELQPGSVMPTP